MFIVFADGSTILSQEGTTQEDTLAMPMYALGILPLIQCASIDVNQDLYTDDAAATGTVLNQKEWWDNINNLGPFKITTLILACCKRSSLYFCTFSMHSMALACTSRLLVDHILVLLWDRKFLLPNM